MRTVTTITRDKLEQYFGSIVPMVGYELRYESVRGHQTNLLPASMTLRNDGCLNMDNTLGINRTNVEFYRIMELADMQTKNYICIPKNLVTVENLPCPIDCVKEVLETLMPGRYMISRTETGDKTGAYGAVYLHYPKLEITNSQGMHHTIEDLFVRVGFGVENMDAYISGMRTSLSPEEVAAGYSHSHLPESCWNSFEGFCLGTGGFAEWLQQNQLQMNAERFAMFLFQLEAYLKWESLEGTPYVSITGLGVNSPSNPTSYINSSGWEEIDRFADRMMAKLNPEWLMPISGTKDYYLNYGLFGKELMELELELYKEIRPSSQLTADYNPELGIYASQAAAYDELPDEMCEDDHGILEFFDIAPRLIEMPKPEKTTTIKRYTSNVLYNVFLRINEKLLHSNAINEKNRVVAQSANHHQAEPSSAS